MRPPAEATAAGATGLTPSPSARGAVMLASILNSDIAVQASVQVVRAFVRLRQVLATHKELAAKLAELEARLEAPDEHITTLFDAIRQLREPPAKPSKRIGFAVETKAS